jgi:hypothetical protein
VPVVVEDRRRVGGRVGGRVVVGIDDADDLGTRDPVELALLDAGEDAASWRK